MTISLSPREQEIVDLIGGEGLTYKAVSRRLEIEVSTIRTHVARIVQKAGIERSPREAIVFVYALVHVHDDAVNGRVVNGIDD